MFQNALACSYVNSESKKQQQTYNSTQLSSVNTSEPTYSTSLDREERKERPNAEATVCLQQKPTNLYTKIHEKKTRTAPQTNFVTVCTFFSKITTHW